MCLAIPGKIVSIEEPSESDSDLSRTGIVDFGGNRREVNLSLVPEATVGDYVIVHVGFAISTMDEAEAEQVFTYLREMQETEETVGRAS